MAAPGTIWFDSVTARNIPTTAPIVGGYIDGRYKWSPGDWGRFPNSVKLTISTQGSDSDAMDNEAGDYRDVYSWLMRQFARGLAHPVVYCNRSDWPSARQQAARTGRYADVQWWIATLDGTQNVPGADSVQFWDDGGKDWSVVHTDGFPFGGSATGDDDLPYSRDDLKSIIREVLDEGTVFGQVNWAGQNKNEFGNSQRAREELDTIYNGVYSGTGGKIDAYAKSTLKPLLDAIKAKLGA